MPTRVPPDQFTAAMADDLVSRGATVLDEWAPGWADTLDLGNLSLRDGEKCVLGQAAGHIWTEMDTDMVAFYQLDDWTEPWVPHFNEASDLLASVIYGFEPAHYGFDYPHWLINTDLVSSHDYAVYHGRIWEMLTCAWLSAAAERRLAADPEGEPPYVEAELARQPLTVHAWVTA